MAQSRQHPHPEQSYPKGPVQPVHAARPGRHTVRTVKRDPKLMRTRSGSSLRGPALMVGGGLAFAAYVFNVTGLKTTVDGFFSGLDQSVHGHDAQVETWFIAALPYLGMLLLAAVVMIFFPPKYWGFKRKKAGVAVPRQELTMHEFADLAKEYGVGAKVARESYRLLLPRYRTRMRAVLLMPLVDDVEMTPAAVRALHVEMLRVSDRQPRHADGSRTFATVLAMMQAVERCADQSIVVASRAVVAGIKA